MCALSLSCVSSFWGVRFVKRCLPVQAVGSHFSLGRDTICGSRMQNVASLVSSDADQKNGLKIMVSIQSIWQI
jgi:hypothetical protein